MWELEVYNPNGSLRRTLTPDDPVASVQWAVRGDGDCLEAAVTGRGLDLRPRDIVAIKAKPTPASPAAPDYRYWGWVVESTHPSAPHVTTTRLAGGRKRLAEVLVRASVLGDQVVGNDVADRAANSAAYAGERARLSLAGRILTGFEVGARLPRFETVAEALEALTATAPGFTVLPGSSYTYDGHTYQPGDEVPAVAWGVRAVAGLASAQIFFRRPSPSRAQLAELGDGLSIEWDALSSEEVVDDVTVVLFDDHNGDAFSTAGFIHPGTWVGPEVLEPVAFRYQRGSAYGAERLVAINPLDGLKAVSWAAHPPEVPASWNNSANAVDGDPATYAHNPAAEGGLPVLLVVQTTVTATRAFRIRYSARADVRVKVQGARAGAGTAIHATLPATNGQQVDHVLLTPFVAPPTLAVLIDLSVDPAQPADTARVYGITALEPDEEVIARIAAAHMTVPDGKTAATLTVPNRLVAPSHHWEVALAAGGTLRGAAGAIEYSLTTEGGMTSRIHLDQALTAGAASQRALLDARIRSTVRTATSARLTP